MRFFPFFIFLLSFSLYAAPTKLALVGKDSRSMSIVDQVAANQALSGDFEFLERGMMDELIQEQKISDETLRQCFPHAELLGILSYVEDKRITQKIPFEFQVLDLNRGEILVKKWFPDKKEGLLPEIIGCLKEANRKRNLPNLQCLSLMPVKKETISWLAGGKDSLEYFEVRLMDALLSYDNVVLMERENLEFVLNEREFTQKTFMLAASSRIGKSQYLLGNNGKVVCEINISDFNGVHLGTVSIPDVTDIDAESLKKKCKPIVDLLKNAIPGDPVSEAAKYYAEYKKNENLFQLFSACALDPENPVYRLTFYFIRMRKLQEKHWRSRDRLSFAKESIKKAGLDAKEKKLADYALRMEPVVQQTILQQERETADRMLESCRLVRSKYPEYPSLLKEYLIASQVFSESGRNDKIPAEELYEEIHRIDAIEKPFLFDVLAYKYSPFYDLAELPVIQNIILKLLTEELELRKTRKYYKVPLGLPQHRNLKSFYGSFPQEFLDRVKETKGQEKSLQKLLFLKLLCTPGVPFDELERERNKITKDQFYFIQFYNLKYYKTIKDKIEKANSPYKDSERPYVELIESLRNDEDHRKAYEMALKIIPDPLPMRRGEALSTALGYLRASLNNDILSHDDEIHDKVLRKIGSPYHFKTLANWDGAQFSLFDDKLYAFFRAARELFVMELPSGEIRKLGKLESKSAHPEDDNWSEFCATKEAFMFFLNGKLCWFDKQSLQLTKKLELRMPNVGIPSGPRIYIPFCGSIYSCSRQGDDWKTEFLRNREPPRFPEESMNFCFYKLYDSGTPGVLLFHEGRTLYRFDVNKEKIEKIDNDMRENVLWRKGNIDIINHRGRILRQTTEVKK